MPSYAQLPAMAPDPFLNRRKFAAALVHLINRLPEKMI